MIQIAPSRIKKGLTPKVFTLHGKKIRDEQLRIRKDVSFQNLAYKVNNVVLPDGTAIRTTYSHGLVTQIISEPDGKSKFEKKQVVCWCSCGVSVAKVISDKRSIAIKFLTAEGTDETLAQKIRVCKMEKTGEYILAKAPGEELDFRPLDLYPYRGLYKEYDEDGKEVRNDEKELRALGWSDDEIKDVKERYYVAVSDLTRIKPDGKPLEVEKTPACGALRYLLWSLKPAKRHLAKYEKVS